MATKPDPFTGFRLTQERPLGTGQIEQQLFRDTQTPQPEPVATKVERKNGTKVAKNQPSKVEPAMQPRRKAGYRITEDAIYAVIQMKVDLLRQFGVKASQEAIVEEAIHMIREDFEKGKEKSRLVRNLSAKVQK